MCVCVCFPSQHVTFARSCASYTLYVASAYARTRALVDLGGVLGAPLLFTGDPKGGFETPFCALGI